MFHAALPELEPLLEKSRESHPAMRRARIQEAAARAEANVAAKAWIPDLSVYGAYRLDTFENGQQPTHGYELGVGMAIPIFRQGQQERARVRAGAAVARFAVTGTWNSIRLRIAAAHGTARSQLALLERLEAQTGRSGAVAWADALQAYREGAIVLGELVEMVQMDESRARARMRARSQARKATLATYCAAGFFPEEAINDLLAGVEK